MPAGSPISSSIQPEKSWERMSSSVWMTCEPESLFFLWGLFSSCALRKMTVPSTAVLSTSRVLSASLLTVWPTSRVSEVSMTVWLSTRPRR